MQFVDVLGVTVVVTALPGMLADVGGTAADGTAVVAAYSLFFGGLLMVAARLGDRVGHRRVVLAALALFGGGSVIGASAGAVWLLATARGVQGMAAAASVPAALRLLTTVVPDGQRRRRAIAAWSAAGAAAGASGFVVGGVLTELASWRLAFWMNLVLAALLAAAIVRLVPRDPPGLDGVRVGWPSATLLTVAATGLVGAATLLGKQAWVAAAVVLTAGALAGGGFVRADRRARHPLLPSAARRSARLGWGAFGSFFNTATTSSSITVATLYLQDEAGVPPLRAAALLVTFSVLVVGGSLAAPRVIKWLGQGRAMGLGLGIIATGNALLACWPSVPGVGAAAGVCGLGIGVGSVAATDLGTAVDEALKATAAGVLNSAAQLGTAVGTALMLLVATAVSARAAWATVALVGVAVAGAAVAARLGAGPCAGSRRVRK
ncbi:MAG: MFS transporter [Nocardioidaceae bacterium]